jgi:hypothetical protein
LAQVIHSGGFMAPAPGNTTTYVFRANGDIERYRSELPRAVVGKLNDRDLAELERSIAEVRPGELVDIDPSGPTGADAPDVSYRVNQGGHSVSVALRGGNFHTYVLEQRAALVIKSILERALRATLDR